jgi:hypothetical protein
MMTMKTPLFVVHNQNSFLFTANEVLRSTSLWVTDCRQHALGTGTFATRIRFAK